MSGYFDSYSRVARLYPVLLTLAPAFCSIILLFPNLIEDSKEGFASAIALGCIKTGEHIVALFDLLGFSSIVGNQHAQDEILELLSDIAASRRDFAVKVKSMVQGASETTIVPSVSAFSDHMVISFDTEDLQKHGLNNYSALRFFQGTAGHLAHRARQLKCLIRGAVTVGPLYHNDGVIFGDGLVQAHELESTIAVYPRVLIAPVVFEGLGQPDWPDLLHDDFDGWSCLEYMKSMLQDMDDYAFGSGVDEKARNDRSGWARTVRATSYEEGDRLAAAGRLRAAQNWKWFARRFDAAMREVNGHRFNADGSPLDFFDP